MENVNILVTDKLVNEGMKILFDQKHFNINILDQSPSEEELVQLASDYDALITKSTTSINERIIKAGKNLKMIARGGVGIDNIDLNSCSDHGILVTNAPEGNIISTAELTLTLILALLRKVSWAHRSILDGEWNRKKYKGEQLSGKSLGIIGLGRIGSALAIRAKALGMDVTAYDPFIPEEKAINIGVNLTSSLENIFKQSDVISVHTPLTPRTHGMIGRNEIELMKKSVRLINCARGGIYVEKDVADALKSGRIAGAAFDVFEQEPPGENPLLKAPNFLTVPHIGAATYEAQVNVAIETAKAVVDFFHYGYTQNSVNFPSIDPEKTSRIKPFLNLSELLGSFLSQITSGPIKKLSIQFSTDLKEEPTHIMKLSALKGFLKNQLTEKVNNVTVLNMVRKKEISIEETILYNKPTLSKQITLLAETDNGANQITGYVDEKEKPKLSNLNEYQIDIHPSGDYLLIKHQELPDVLGMITTALGNHNINILHIKMSRIKENPTITLIKLVDTIPSTIVEQLKDIVPIIEVYPISLSIKNF